jgi:peptidoglycan/xylan/chitin deacetylase (PgdA/CDA1 family)
MDGMRYDLRSSFSNSGTVAWNNVTQIEIKLNPMSGVTPSFTIDSLKSYIKNPYSNSKANIIFALDDANTSAYTVVYPYLESKGIKASFFCVGTYVGTYNHMTLNNMKELYSKGHDILNHSWSHPNPVGMTYAALAKDVQDMREYLWNNGFIKGIDIFAYPNALTTLFKQVVKDLEFNVGRNGSGSFMCGRKPYDY